MKNPHTDAQLLGFWNHLDMTASAIERAREKELKKFNLSVIQSKVLSTLSTLEHDPTLGELSRWLFREHNSVSGITDRMAKKGLIKKYQDPLRKHLTRLSVTEKGERAHLKLVRDGEFMNILSPLQPEEFEEVKMLLEKLFKRAVAVAGLKTPAQMKA